MEKKKVYFELITKWASFIASIVTILGIFIGTNYINNIANNIAATFTNNVNVNTEQKTMAEELYDAQNYVEQGMYESAMSIYQKWKNSSAEANINIGYLYSNGLGTEKDTEIAGMYYKIAYNMGEQQGLVNYLSINLAKPTSYAQTITALRCGYEENNEETIRFLDLLMTGKMSPDSSEELKKSAGKFWTLSEYEQKEKLDNYTLETNEYIEQLKDDKVPENTDFITYQLTTINGNEYLYKCIAGYVEVYDNETKEFYWEPVYDIKNYYSKHSKYFIYADLLFEEKFIRS